VGGAAALLVFYLAWEWYLSPQARIERFLNRVAVAAEETNATKLLSFISRDYSDFRGLDYETLETRMEGGFEGLDRLNVTVGNVRAEVEGDEARARFDLTVVAVRGQERYLLVGAPMQPEKLRVHLRKESGDWKILSAAKGEPSGTS
jgi:hypothetical protein